MTAASLTMLLPRPSRLTSRKSTVFTYFPRRCPFLRGKINVKLTGFCFVVAWTDLISTITDPEHPVSLGQLSVINLADIRLTPSPRVSSRPDDGDALVDVFVGITPTITHCSLATILGLAVRVRLEQALPPNYRVDVRCKESTHVQDDQVNKQLADKERVAAALENDSLRSVLDKMLETCY